MRGQVESGKRCTVCEQRFEETDARVGDGDGSGQRFAHKICYDNREKDRQQMSNVQQQQVRCKQCGSLVMLVPQPLGLAPHACASVRAREELSLELVRAKTEEAQARARVQRLEVEIKRADEVLQVQVAEQRAREWLDYLVACLHPCSEHHGFLKNLNDRHNWNGRDANVCDQSEFVFALPSGHEVTLTVKPGREVPPAHPSKGPYPHQL